MAELPIEPGFKTPERYFEQLPTRIMQRTAYASAQPLAPVAWYRQLRTGLAGASLGLVFALSFLVSNYFEPAPSPEAAMAQVSQHDIYQYLLTHAELETADLAEVPAVKTRPSLEFLDVRTSDLTDEVAREMVDEYKYN